MEGLDLDFVVRSAYGVELDGELDRAVGFAVEEEAVVLSLSGVEDGVVN